MNGSRDRSYKWVFYACSGLLFIGPLVRAPLWIEDGATLFAALLLLLIWLTLLATEVFVYRLWRRWPTAYLVLQSCIVVTLLLLPSSYDFFAVLFGALGMYAVMRLGLAVGAAWVAVFVPLIALPLTAGFEPLQVAALTIIYTGVCILLAGYAHAARRAEEAYAGNRALGDELESANTELREYSRQLERLAVAEERNRLARELHDSVTQTVFSMNLAAQSTAILFEREPDRVDMQLERLSELTRNALAEMRVLISELDPRAPVEGGLTAAIRRDIERRVDGGVEVSLEVEGPVSTNEIEQQLSAAEEQALLRITQEALNNVMKHSGSSTATVRVRLRPPFQLEIEDHGLGFDPREAAEGTGVGLKSMSERAAEIGWRLEVVSLRGAGTTLIVKRPAGEGGTIDDR